jgi:hypothetical protein
MRIRTRSDRLAEFVRLLRWFGLTDEEIAALNGGAVTDGSPEAVLDRSLPDDLSPSELFDRVRRTLVESRHGFELAPTHEPRSAFVALSLALKPYGCTFAVTDGDGRPITAPASTDGTYRLSLIDSAGNERTTTFAYPEGCSATRTSRHSSTPSKPTSWSGSARRSFCFPTLATAGDSFSSTKPSLPTFAGRSGPGTGSTTANCWPRSSRPPTPTIRGRPPPTGRRSGRPSRSRPTTRCPSNSRCPPETTTRGARFRTGGPSGTECARRTGTTPSTASWRDSRARIARSVPIRCSSASPSTRSSRTSRTSVSNRWTHPRRTARKARTGKRPRSKALFRPTTRPRDAGGCWSGTRTAVRARPSWGSREPAIGTPTASRRPPPLRLPRTGPPQGGRRGTRGVEFPFPVRSGPRRVGRGPASTPRSNFVLRSGRRFPLPGRRPIRRASVYVSSAYWSLLKWSHPPVRAGASSGGRRIGARVPEPLQRGGSEGVAIRGTGTRVVGAAGSGNGSRAVPFEVEGRS